VIDSFQDNDRKPTDRQTDGGAEGGHKMLSMFPFKEKEKIQVKLLKLKYNFSM